MKKIKLLSLIAVLSCAVQQSASASGHGKLQGRFSISNDRQVQFSQGNLQYNVGTDTWAFADQQYEFLADANLNIGNPDYSGSLDLFAWSCESCPYGVSPSNKDADYTGAFIDWGTLFPGEGWRTLTQSEWTHLFARTKDNHKLWTMLVLPARAESEDKLFGLAIFPDNWVKPEGITFQYGFYDWDDNEGWAANTITYEQWAELEAAGAVFLPGAGARAGGYDNKWNGAALATQYLNDRGDYAHVDNYDWMGYYWLNTQDSRPAYQHCASYIILPAMYESPAGSDNWLCTNPAVWSREKRRGNSVRLVSDVPVEMGDADNADAINNVLNDKDGQQLDAVSIVRPVSRNTCYSTLCLPFSMNAAQIAASSLAEAEIREFAGAQVENNMLSLTLRIVTSIEAGKPYFIKYSNGDPLERLDFHNVTIDKTAPVAVTFNNVTLQGTFVPYYIEAQTQESHSYLFLGQNNTLFWPNEAGWLNPFRAFFTVETGSINSPVRRGMAAVFYEPADIPADAENAQSDNNLNTKVVENGRLVIIKNGVRYNALGQIVK